MDTIKLLKAQAATKRNAVIARAHAQYQKDLVAIRLLIKQIKPREPRPQRKTAKGVVRSEAYGGMTTIQAAKAVMADGRPRRSTEIVLEMQARGYRPDEDPEKLIRTVRSALTYHHDFFTKHAGKLWTLAEPK
jgi:hypothetical protein